MTSRSRREIFSGHDPSKHLADLGLDREGQPIEVRPLGTVRASTTAAPRTLGGATVIVELPAGFALTTISCHVRFRSDPHTGGFQSTHRGYGLYALVPTHLPADLEGVVDLLEGTLAFYRFSSGNDALDGFALWQGSHHDLFTFDFDSMEQAVAVFAAFGPADDQDGIELKRPWGWEDRGDYLTFEFGNFVVEVRSDEGVDLPDWQGFPGELADFYRVDADVLAITGPGAFAILQARAEAGPTIDDVLEQLVRDFGVTWTTNGRPNQAQTLLT